MQKTTDKKHIRQTLRHQRRALSPDERTAISEKIAQQVFSLPIFQQSHHIAYYIAHDGEVETHSIIEEAEKHKKESYLPILDESLGHHLTFYAYHSSDSLVKNRFGIDEPNTTEQPCIPADQLDLVFLPLVAFDEQGNRVGRGAGYYDRTFAFVRNLAPKKKPCLIALAYDFQKIAAITPDPWDISLNFIVTEKKIYGISRAFIK